MAPSIYEYRSTAEWEQAMAEWCAENEPQDTSFEYGVKYLDGYIQRWEWFYTDDLRADWIKKHPQFTVIRLTEHGKIEIKPILHPGKPGAPDHLDGGSRADYRMAGYNRY